MKFKVGDMVKVVRGVRSYARWHVQITLQDTYREIALGKSMMSIFQKRTDK